MGGCLGSGIVVFVVVIVILVFMGVNHLGTGKKYVMQWLRNVLLGGLRQWRRHKWCLCFGWSWRQLKLSW